MAKTIYTKSNVEQIFSEIRQSFSTLGVKVPQFTVLPTGTENRFSVVRRGSDGTDVATEVSGGMLRRLKETLFSAANLGLLVDSAPSVESAWAFAQHVQDEHDRRQAELEEQRKLREAEAAQSEALTAALQADESAKVTLETLRVASPAAYQAYVETLEEKGRKLLEMAAKASV